MQAKSWKSSAERCTTASLMKSKRPQIVEQMAMRLREANFGLMKKQLEVSTADDLAAKTAGLAHELAAQWSLAESQRRNSKRLYGGGPM